jgi:hypothetical protein
MGHASFLLASPDELLAAGTGGIVRTLVLLIGSIIWFVRNFYLFHTRTTLSVREDTNFIQIICDLHTTDNKVLKGAIVQVLGDELVNVGVLTTELVFHLFHRISKATSTEILVVISVDKITTDLSVLFQRKPTVTYQTFHVGPHVHWLADVRSECEYELVEYNSALGWSEWEERHDKVDASGDGSLSGFSIP